MRATRAAHARPAPRHVRAGSDARIPASPHPSRRFQQTSSTCTSAPGGWVSASSSRRSRAREARTSSSTAPAASGSPSSRASGSSSSTLGSRCVPSIVPTEARSPFKTPLGHVPGAPPRVAPATRRRRATHPGRRSSPGGDPRGVRSTLGPAPRPFGARPLARLPEPSIAILPRRSALPSTVVREKAACGNRFARVSAPVAIFPRAPAGSIRALAPRVTNPRGAPMPPRPRER